MRNSNTLEFLEQWEIIHNPNFNRAGSGTVRLKATSNSFSISPSKWIHETKAIGIITKKGRFGGGTFVHRDIALNFCYWLSPAFQVSAGSTSPTGTLHFKSFLSKHFKN